MTGPVPTYSGACAGRITKMDIRVSNDTHVYDITVRVELDVYTEECPCESCAGCDEGNECEKIGQPSGLGWCAQSFDVRYDEAFYDETAEGALRAMLRMNGLSLADDLLSNGEVATQLESAFGVTFSGSKKSDSVYAEINGLSVGVRNHHGASSQAPVDYLIDTKGGITQAELDAHIANLSAHGE